MLVAPGTKIYACDAIAGMVIQLPDSREQIAVGAAVEGYGSIKITGEGGYPEVSLPYGETVKVLGYFNPASGEY
jgi:hypothetical protein